MSEARKGPPNGQASPRVPMGAASSMVLGSGLEIPVSAVQRSPFPRLQAFAARGQIGKDLRTMQAYELRFGVALGLQVAKDISITLTPGMPARAMAAIFRQLVERLELWADDCELAAIDPRDQPQAQKGLELTPVDKNPVELTPVSVDKSQLAAAEGPCPARSCPRAAGSLAPGRPCGWDEAAGSCAASGCPLATDGPGQASA